MSRTATIIRFLVCGLIATVVFVGGGAWLVHYFVGDKPKQVLGMDIVRNVDLITTVPAIEGTAATAEKVDEPERLVPGFVQIAFTVGQDGRAHDIHILRAVPEGVYEQAARAVISARHFTPPEPGKAHSGQRTEIVHFSVPAGKLHDKSSSSSSADGGA